MKIEIDARPLQHSAFRGIGRYAENLIENIISLDNSNSYELYFDPNYGIDGHYKKFLSMAHVFGEKQPAFLDYKSVFYYRYWMKRQLRQLNYDLIHFPSQIHLPPILPKNSIITVLDVINLALKEMFYKFGIAHWADVLYMRKMFNSAKKIITISEHSKKDLIDIVGIMEQKIEVIYLGIDAIFSKEYDKNKIDAVIRKFNISGEYLLYYGGSEERKNVARLIETFSELSKEFPELKLVLVLNLNDPPAKRLKELANNSNIIFIQSLLDEELVAVLKGAKAFVFPSLYEGFGFPPVEANAAGVPVASSPNSSLKEALNDAAIFFDPCDKNDMYRSIKELLTNNNLRNILIENGKKNAKRFSWKKCAEETLKLYEKCNSAK